MGELYPDPNLRTRLFLAQQLNRSPFISDSVYGDDLLKTQGSNFRTPIIIGKRNGIPQDQPIDYFLQRHFQSNPYVRGMHPYTSNMLVDVVPSVYNTNPLAGRGGYEKNLVSYNGTRPLATALDEPQEIAQRLFEDEFKLAPNNPLSMQYTVNHSTVEKRARGDMYDAFRLGIETNEQGVQPDYDTVLQSKRQKGYNTSGVLPKGSEGENIATYFENQKPLRTGDFKQGVKDVIKEMTITPAPQADMAVQVGHDREDVVGGGENTFGDLGDGRNLVETLHDFSDLAYLNDKPNRAGGNNNSFFGNRSGPGQGNASTVSFLFHSPADDPGWGHEESKTENFNDAVNILGGSGFNAQLHDSRFSTPVAHGPGRPQQFGDSISPIDYYHVSPNLSHLLPPPTPRNKNSHYNRREVQLTPTIGEHSDILRDSIPHRRVDNLYGKGQNMHRRPRRNPSEAAQRQMNAALGPQLAQDFADLDALRNSNQQRIGYLQL